MADSPIHFTKTVALETLLGLGQVGDEGIACSAFLLLAFLDGLFGCILFTYSHLSIDQTVLQHFRETFSVFVALLYLYGCVCLLSGHHRTAPLAGSHQTCNTHALPPSVGISWALHMCLLYLLSGGLLYLELYPAVWCGESSWGTLCGRSWPA